MVSVATEQNDLGTMIEIKTFNEMQFLHNNTILI